MTAIKASKLAHYEWKRAGRPGSEHILTKTRLHAKKALRAVTCQGEAIKRDEFYTDVMKSGDTNQFHKLIARHSGRHNKRLTEALRVENNLIFNPQEQIQVWENHYSKLYGNKGNGTSVISEKSIINILADLQPDNPITEWEVINAIKQLNKGKAPDANHIQAEHLRYADLELTPFLVALFNQMVTSRDIPPSLKEGILTNVPKKDKSELLCNNYRGITVTDLVGKVLERVWKNREDPIQAKKQSRQQFGFTRGLAPSMSSVSMTEALGEAKDSNTSLFISSLDASKAFDVVNHDLLLDRLLLAGHSPGFVAVLRGWYTGLTNRVKWKGLLGEPAPVNRGVRQGGILSTSLYKAYINPLLEELENSGLGLQIGPVHLGNPTCADDVLLIANAKWKLQLLLDKARSFADLSEYELNPTKSAIIRYVPKGSLEHRQLEDQAWTLGDSDIPIQDTLTHLGLERSSPDFPDCNIQARINLARRTVYALLGTGIHGVNGLNPSTSIHIFKVYVQSRFLSGLEALVIPRKLLEELNKYHLGYLRAIQGMPQHTAKVAAYLLLGDFPMEGHIHLRQLSLLGQMIRCENSNMNMLVLRQAAMKGHKSRSWFSQASLTLYQYGLPPIVELLDLKPSKDSWKAQCKKAVRRYWHNILSQEAASKSTLIRMCVPNHPGTHQSWSSVDCSSREVRKATVKVWVLCGVYNTQMLKAKFNAEIEPTCLLCGVEDESLSHMLLVCPELDEVREGSLRDLKNTLYTVAPDLPSWDQLDEETKVQIIVDCSNIGLQGDSGSMVEKASRQLVYNIHSRREHILSLMEQ